MRIEWERYDDKHRPYIGMKMWFFAWYTTEKTVKTLVKPCEVTVVDHVLHPSGRINYIVLEDSNGTRYNVACFDRWGKRNDALHHGFTDEAECKAVYNDFVRKETKRINTVQKSLQKMLDIIQPV